MSSQDCCSAIVCMFRIASVGDMSLASAEATISLQLMFRSSPCLSSGMPQPQFAHMFAPSSVRRSPVPDGSGRRGRRDASPGPARPDPPDDLPRPSDRVVRADRATPCTGLRATRLDHLLEALEIGRDLTVVETHRRSGLLEDAIGLAVHADGDPRSVLSDRVEADDAVVPLALG